MAYQIKATRFKVTPVVGRFSSAPEAVKAITTSTTLAADGSDAGKFIFANAISLNVTLPSAAIRDQQYTIATNIVSSGTGLRVTPQSTDQIVGLGITPGNGKYVQNTQATAEIGDFVTLVSDGGTKWYAVTWQGIWAREA